MSNVWIGVLVLLGFGGVTLGGFLLYDWLKGKVGAVGDAASKAYDWTAEQASAAAAWAGEKFKPLEDVGIDAATRTQREFGTAKEREDGSKFYGSGLAVEAARVADVAKKARAAKDKAPTAVETLQAQLRTIDSGGGAGLFDDAGNYVSRAEIVQRLKALGVTVADAEPAQTLPDFLQGSNVGINQRLLEQG